MTLYDLTPALDLMRQAKELGLSEQIGELAVLGYTVLPEILSDNDVAALHDMATSLLDSPAAAQDPSGRRVWGLLRRQPDVASLLAHPNVNLLLDYLLGASRRLSSIHINSIRPGAPAQPLHTDIALVPPPLAGHALLANSIWCLDPWQPNHGATEVVPGSHLSGTQALPDCLVDQTVTVEAQPGSVIIFHGNLWHRSGPSGPGTTNERIGILALYCRSFLAPQEDYTDVAIPASSTLTQQHIGIDHPYPFGPDGPGERFAHAQPQALSPFR